MTRMLTAACLVLGGLVSSAPAQVYTSYYAPSSAYYHAPPYSYSAYRYSTNYGPLRVFDPRWWAGVPPYTAGYASPYTTNYTAGYSSPFASSYTAGYSPITTTSYYSPTVDTAVAYYSAPSIGVSSACCPTTCCDPCATGCASCSGGNCPGGNCAMNYAPGDMSPQPDPALSGSSGSKTFESESGNNPGSANPGTRNQDQGDDFREPYNRDVPDDGFSGSRGTGYRPEQRIEQKAPTDLPNEAGPEAAGEPSVEEPEAEGEPLSVPSGEPDAAAPLLNLDTQVSQAPSRLPRRTSLRARFGSPSLARAEVDPAKIPSGESLQLVRK